MDRTDRFINNRAPRRLLLIFGLMLLLSACAAWYVSGKCADRLVRDQLRAELAAAGGGKLTALPDDEDIAAGEARFSEYSIDRDLPPEYMQCYDQVRMTVFISVFLPSALLSLIWFVISVMEIMAVYRDLEKLRNECVAAADDPDAVINLYGEDLGSVNRISSASELLVNRLNDLRADLSSEQRYLKGFLADLSHQIKTSLAVVRLNTDMLCEMKELPAERREKLADEVQLNLDGMERLVVEAIKLAKLDAEAVEYHMEPQSAAEVCELALRRILPMLRSKGIGAVKKLEDDFVLDCDKGWLCEAVENIIKNSADHSGCTEVTAELENGTVMMKIILSDNGRGIPQYDIPRLFDRFSSGSDDRSMRSSGLGMSIARNIVRAHGGEILVYSEEGRGTRFEFVFLKG